MQQIELEQAVGDVQAISAAVEATEGKSLYIGLVATVITSFLALVGLLIRNNMSRQRVTDTANSITVMSLQDAQARIRELEGQVRDLLNEALANSKAQIEANSRAQRAADSADRASELAQQAEREARAAREDADQSRRLLAIYIDYSRRMRAIMLENGLTPPPEPDLNLEPEQ